MSGARQLTAGLVLAASVVLPSSCKRAAPSTTTETSCATDSDCAGGEACGFSNAGGDHSCTARGECVMPIDRTSTMLCGCGGKAIELVVDDVDAGIYYWSGVIQGEQGFPPCGDAAIAPSSGDGSSAEPDDAAPESQPADAQVDGGTE